MTSKHRLLLIGACLALGVDARGAPSYPWSPSSEAEPLSRRFAPPSGFRRAEVDDFGTWLRGLPLAQPGDPVRLYDGSLKPRQDVHAAVVAIDVGDRDLQQCADAVMRLRAEYLLSHGRAITFHPDVGQARALRFDPGTPDPGRKRFRRYLTQVFAEAGSASLQAELAPARGAVQPGDVLIQGGHPGHAILVLDVAVDAAGNRRLLLAQSYMPAQSIHVLLVDPARPAAGAWFEERALDTALGLLTPEWRPFHRADVRRFPR